MFLSVSEGGLLDKPRKASETLPAQYCLYSDERNILSVNDLGQIIIIITITITTTIIIIIIIIIIKSCDGLASHPGGSSNTLNSFMLQKPD